MPPRRVITLRYEYEYSKHPDPKDVALALLNGVDILLVDPLLYQSLVPPLEQMKIKYEDTKEDKVVEKIDWFIDYINTYPERKMISDKLCVVPRKPKVKPPPFDRDQLDSEIDTILNSDQNLNYSNEEYSQLISEMRSRRSKLVLNQEFQTAELYNQKIKKLISLSEATKAFEFSNNRANEIRAKVNEAEESLQDIKSRWFKVFNNFQSDKEKQLQKLKEEQENEYNELAQKLNETYPKTLPKISCTHLELKRQEEIYAAAKKFIEAGEIRNKLTQYEEREQEEFTAQWEAENRLKLNQLAKKHQELYDIKLYNLKRDETNLNRVMNTEIKAAERKLQSLKDMLEKTEMPSDSTAPKLRSTLPNLRTARQVDPREVSFRQKALINMKIYTRRPPNTARGVRHNYL